MADHGYYVNAIAMADEWLESHRVGETWRLVNLLRDALVRSQSESIR